MKDGFASYGFPTGEMYSLSKKAVHLKKRVSAVDGVPTTVTLMIVHVTFRASVSRVNLASFQQDYEAYRRQSEALSEAERAGTSGIFDLDACSEKDLVWAKLMLWRSPRRRRY